MSYNMVSGKVTFAGSEKDFEIISKKLEVYKCVIQKDKNGICSVEMDTNGPIASIPFVIWFLEPYVSAGVLDTRCDDESIRYVYAPQKKAFIVYEERKGIYTADDAAAAFQGEVIRKISDNADQMEFVGCVIDIFEDFLEEKGIAISNDEHEGSEGEAMIYGSDYDLISDELKKLFRNYGIFPNSEK